MGGLGGLHVPTRKLDTEATAENKEAKISEYLEDLLHTQEVDPHIKDHPGFWSEVTEWCSMCKKTRQLKLVMDQKVKRVGKDDKGYRGGCRSDRENGGGLRRNRPGREGLRGEKEKEGGRDG